MGMLLIRLTGLLSPSPDLWSGRFSFQPLEIQPANNVPLFPAGSNIKKAPYTS
jgi:hypothetical protein